MELKKEFLPADIEATQPNEKVALLATVNPAGLPHVTLITSLLALDPTHMAFGEFSWGMSKWHVKSNPKCGFLIMTLDRKLWRGTARWTHSTKEGKEYEMFNRKPMFRYNTYFGINTVHYLDLAGTFGEEALPLGAIIRGALTVKINKGGAAEARNEKPMNGIAMGIFNRLDSLKFLSYINDDGYPSVIPLLPCQAADEGRLAFSASAYREELMKIRPGTEVSVFALTLQMEDVLVRGVFNGFRRYRAATMGTVDINWVYNSMPPVHGQVYPEVPVKPVVSF